jgi:hypothetical protein
MVLNSVSQLLTLIVFSTDLSKWLIQFILKITIYDGQNIYVPPKSICWNLNPNVIVLENKSSGK